MAKKKLKLNLSKSLTKKLVSNKFSDIDLAEGKVMSDNNFFELRDLIYDTSGVYISAGNKYRINQFVNENLSSMNLESFKDYLSFLTRPDGKKEIYNIVGKNSINHDQFFVNKRQLDAFENFIVPELISKKIAKGESKLNIWFTNTSRGEEVYTLAILLADKIIPKFPNVQFKIYASDINKYLLDFAKKAEYTDESIRDLPDGYLSKYFDQTQNRFKIKQEIRNLIKFRKIILFDRSQIATLPEIDAVFCSSILVYFDQPSRQKLVKNIQRAMSLDSYLLLGKSESLGNIDHNFDLLHFNKVMAYWNNRTK